MGIEEKNLRVNDIQSEYGEGGAMAIARTAKAAIALLSAYAGEDRFDHLDLDYDLSVFNGGTGMEVLDFLRDHPESMPKVIRIGSTGPSGIRTLSEALIRMADYSADLSTATGFEKVPMVYNLKEK